MERMTLLGLLLIAGLHSAHAVQYSKLWGTSGEAWKPWGRLAEASYAGYDGNRSWRPVYENVCDAKDLGAKGDGRTDDTAAIQATINCAAAAKGAAYLPEGTYVITKRIFITTSNTVLRGAGKDKTFIYIPKSLEEVYGAGDRLYSFSDGFIVLQGGKNGKLLSAVTAPARRGQRRVYVQPGHTIQPGAWVRLLMSDPSTGAYRGSLVNYLYSGKDDSSALDGTPQMVHFVVKVKKVGPDYVDFERHLGYDVRPEWRPEIWAITNRVTASGVEDLTIKFPFTTYKGHFKEAGYNAIYLKNTLNSWVKNVKVLNCDNGVFVTNSIMGLVAFVDVGVDKDRTSYGMNGHHAISVGTSTDVAVIQFNIMAKWIHDLSVTDTDYGVVFRDGKGYDLVLDCHKFAPNQVLFSNINVGIGSRVFNIESGRDDRGLNLGSNSTFWNINTAKGDPITLPPCLFGSNINFVGNFVGETCRQMGWLVERIPTGQLSPVSIGSSMLATRPRRLGVTNQT